MELDLESKYANRAYSILAGLVTPRPIALVTTIGPDGVVNAAPFSFFNILGAEPPIVAFAPGDRNDGSLKDTAKNVHLNHEFVVNLVNETIADAMVRCAESLPYGVSELIHSGLTTKSSSVVQPPRLAESPASLECTEWGTLRIGANRIIIGCVKRVHICDEFFDTANRRVRTEEMRLIGRLTGSTYCRTQDCFEIRRRQ